ncbi:MAG TPA: CBS domain-containing protein [Polyangiales bacterium]|nr:CBS domain-containing protein [Polyangiales bacterium]
MNTEPALMSRMIEASESEPTQVGEIMTRNPITLNEEDDLSTVQEEMQNIGLRHIPVVDGKKLVGLVSHRDLLAHTLHTQRRNSMLDAMAEHEKHERFVADIMTRGVKTARIDTPLAEAAGWIATGKFGCLPVVDDDGTLLGIVTENDFVKLIAARWNAHH